MANHNANTLTSVMKHEESKRDLISKKAGQLHSMLMVTYGGGFEAFHDYSDEIKDNYFWACADLAKEIEKLADEC